MIMNEEEKLSLTPEQLKAAIMDCKDICSSLQITPASQILTDDQFFEDEEAEVPYHSDKPGFWGALDDWIHRGDTMKIKRFGTARWPAEAQYFNFAYSYNIMPYTTDTARLTKIMDKYEAYLMTMNKKTVKDVMPFFIMMIGATLCVVILLVVFNSGMFGTS